MDMAYNNEERLGISDFMQKTSTYRNSSVYGKRSSTTIRDDEDVFINMARRNSLNSKRIQATRRRKKVDNSLSGVLKRHWKGLVVTMGLGAALFAGAQALGDAYHEIDMLDQNPVVVATNQAVSNHISRTDDLQNWQIDTYGVANDIDNILENGGDSAIVLGTLATRLDQSYAQDDLAAIVEHSFGQDPDKLVQSLNPERYEEGIQYPDFKSDVRNYIIQQTEAEIARKNIDTNNQLEEMFNFSSVNTDSDVKGMGGK